MVIGIYKNKLFLFLFLGLTVFFANKYVGFPLSTVSADRAIADIADNMNMSGNRSRFYLEMNLKNDGSIEVDGKKISESIIPKVSFDELRYIILDKPENLYSELEVDLILPRKLTKLENKPEIIAVHGAEPEGTSFVGDRIIYKAKDIGPDATITITAAFPKGYLTLSANKKVEETIGVIPASYWLAISLALPILAAMLFLSVAIRSRGNFLDKIPDSLLQSLPERTPPAVAGALVDGKVGPRSITATLVDLAQRGFIEIYNRGEDFVIFKKQYDIKKTPLRPFEVTLLDKIFMPKQKAAGSFDVETRIARHLFSRKIALSYLEIYDEGLAHKYFFDAPARTHLRYRMMGIITFCAGIAGYAISAFFAPDPKFVLFFWISLVIFGILIVNFAPRITSLSPRGVEYRTRWLRFRNYLAQNELVAAREAGLFEKYLPYAIAFGVEADWASRFIEENFVKPDWYDYIADVNGVENFAKSLLPIIDYVAKAFDASSDPLVK